MGEYNTNLPPGFRFFPSDEELIVHFLYRKASSLPCQPNIIPSLDLHHFDPWDLNGKALQGGNQWYFFTHATQFRASPNGFWKPLDIEEPIASGGKDVGVKKSLVFYLGEAPEGIKTNWVMHEYHLSDSIAPSSGSGSSSNNNKRSSSKRRGNQRTEAGSKKWVLCRVYEAACGSQASFHDDGTELSCLDEVFLSLDDLDEVSFPNNF